MHLSSHVHCVCGSRPLPAASRVARGTLPARQRQRQRRLLAASPEGGGQPSQQLSPEEALKVLGVSSSNSFDEVLQAKHRLLTDHEGDQVKQQLVRSGILGCPGHLWCHFLGRTEPGQLHRCNWAKLPIGPINCDFCYRMLGLNIAGVALGGIS